MIRRRGRVAAALVAPLALAFAVHAAFATSVVVPTDYATIQAAVTAVQGSSGATVEIDSNATFAESVVATDSVTIQAGTGFTPTIRGDGTNCGGFGVCTVGIIPTSAIATHFVLSGVRLLPRSGATTTDAVVLIENNGSGTAASELDAVTITDPASAGPIGVNIALATPGVGSNSVTINGGSITLGGSAASPTEGISMFRSAGSLTVKGLALTLNGPYSAAFGLTDFGTGITFSLTHSTITVGAPGPSYFQSLGGLYCQIDAALEDNDFHLSSTPQLPGWGIFIDNNAGGNCQTKVKLSRNRFFAASPNAGAAIRTNPFAPNDVLTLTADDNVFFGIDAFSLVPYGGSLTATLINNTIDRAPGDGVFVSVPSGTTVNATLANTLITNSGKFGIEYQNNGGSGGIGCDYCGFYANASGNVSGFPQGATSVDGNPLYRNEPAGDLRLTASSPMIDKGLNNYVISPVDVIGNPRIYKNDTVDIGAYEFTPGVLDIPTLDEKVLALLAALLLLSAAWFLRR